MTDTPLIDTSIPNCNKTNPYFDGISCINCQKPFIIFDIKSVQCVTCEADSVYNDTTHTCDPKPKIYISTNFNKLAATNNTSIDAYKQ